MAQHFKTDDNRSLCEESGQADVFMWGDSAPISSAGQPSDYCSGCNKPEPEWIWVPDREYEQLERNIF